VDKLKEILTLDELKEIIKKEIKIQYLDKTVPSAYYIRYQEIAKAVYVKLKGVNNEEI